MKSYAKREPAGGDGLGLPATAQDTAAFGGLPEILNQSPRVQAQLKLDRSLNQGNETGMPDGLKAGIEEMSGLSLDGVKVHYNSPEPAQLNALAYAQGTDIHVAPGQEQHLPHEAWHVVQQAQGRVRPTMQTQGVDVNDDPGLEREADVMGSKAERATAPLQRKPLRSPGMFEARKVAQRVNLKDIETQRIRVEGGDVDYEAYYDDAKAGTLELFEDDEGRMWINYVETNEKLQGKGIGLMMLQKAVQEHGALYASRDEREYHEDRSDVNGRDDLRQLSEEGAALVASAIRNGIMKEEWLTHPSMMGGHLGNDEEEGMAEEENAPLLDFSDADLPPLPTENFTWAVGYYKLFQAIDGDSLEMAGVSLHARGQEPVYKDFDYPLGAHSEEQISQSLASYYEIGEDHVKVIPMSS